MKKHIFSHFLAIIAILSLLASCSKSEFDFDEFGKTGVFTMDYSNPKTTRVPPLGTSEIKHITIPARGCDTIIEFVTPGLLFDVLPYNGEESIKVSNCRTSSYSIPSSFSREDYIWQFGQVAITHDEINFKNMHPMRLRITAAANKTKKKKTMLLDIERNYIDPTKYMEIVCTSDYEFKPDYEYYYAVNTDMISFIAITQEYR